MYNRWLFGISEPSTVCLGLRLKLWDCDTYELITSLTGHACEILAMALSQEQKGLELPRYPFLNPF